MCRWALGGLLLQKVLVVAVKVAPRHLHSALVISFRKSLSSTKYFQFTIQVFSIQLWIDMAVYGRA